MFCRIVLLSVPVALLTVSMSQAAPVVWTIDNTASALGVSGTGIAPISGTAAKLRIIVQGTIPGATATPTLPVKMTGNLVTDTDFVSSIKFLKTGTVEGKSTGNFKPDQDGFDNALPGDIGSTVQAKLGAAFLSVADATLRDMQYDLSAGDPIALVGGTFPTSGLALSFTSGHLDYRGYGVGASLGSGSNDLADSLDGDATLDRIVDGGDYTIWADHYDPSHLLPGSKNYQGEFTGDGFVDGGDYTIWADNYLQTSDPFISGPNSGVSGTISTFGSSYKLTIPIDSKVHFVITEGETSTATDDIVVDLTFKGTIVALAPIPAAASAIPEPSTLALAGIGALALLARGATLRRRRVD